jgi:hypothetical protein
LNRDHCSPHSGRSNKYFFQLFPTVPTSSFIMSLFDLLHSETIV